MTFEEVPDQPRRSNFWKPSAEDSQKEGVFVRCEAPKPGKEKFGLTYVIKEPNGHELSLPNHWSLIAKMEKIKPGSYVKLEFQGKSGKEFRYKVMFDSTYKPQATLDSIQPGSHISDPLGALIQELKKADGWDDKSFWDRVGNCTTTIGDGMALVEKMKQEGKIVNQNGIWRAA